MSDTPSKYAVWAQANLMGTVELRDGKLILSSETDLEGLRDYIEVVRLARECTSDTEIFERLPDIACGTIHLREPGDTRGLSSPTEV